VLAHRHPACPQLLLMLMLLVVVLLLLGLQLK